MLGGAAALWAPHATWAQETGDAWSRASVLELLRSLIGDAERPLTGASVAWLKGEDPVARVWAGWRTVAAGHPAGSLPIDGGTMFRIASISKLAQALAMLRLHDARVLDLDADIGPLLRAPVRHPRYPNVPITPRLLLSHRSGLLDTLNRMLADGEALRRMLANPANWGAEDPGRMFRYSNFGSVVLATAMEAAARQPFDALMQRWLFDPLGLGARYHVGALNAAQRDDLATLYRRPDRSPAWVAQFDARGDAPHPFATPSALSAIGENASVHSPQGGLRISVSDLSRVTQLLMLQGRWEGRRLLSADAYSQLLGPAWTLAADSPGETSKGLFRSWGLGLQRFTDQSDVRGGDRLHPRGGLKAYGHLGLAYGLLSGLIFRPPEGGRPAWGLVYVINGTSQGAEETPGRYSSLTRTEERVIESLLDVLSLARDTA